MRRWRLTGWLSAVLFVAAAGTPLVFASSSAPFWEKNGAAVFYNDGNVGIGTSSPAVKLDVVGASKMHSTLNILYDDNDARSQHLYIQDKSDPAQKLYLGIDGDDQYASLQYLREGSHWGPLALQASGGNVGIGITSPKAKLHTSGGFAVGVGSSISTTDGNKTSIQLATDTAYGGVHDNHTGTLMYSTLPGSWGSGEFHVRLANNWRSYNSEDAARISASQAYFQGSIRTDHANILKTQGTDNDDVILRRDGNHLYIAPWGTNTAKNEVVVGGGKNTNLVVSGDLSVGGTTIKKVGTDLCIGKCD